MLLSGWITKINSDVFLRMKTSYENGFPILDVAATYGVSRQSVSKIALKYAWMKKTSHSYSYHIKGETDFRRAFQRDDRDDQRLIESHFLEWQLVRQHLQSAIDHTDLVKAELVQKYAETLSLIHNAERSLRSDSTKGRLKSAKLQQLPIQKLPYGLIRQSQGMPAPFIHFQEFQLVSCLKNIRWKPNT